MKLSSLFQRLDEGRKDQYFGMMPQYFLDDDISGLKNLWTEHVNWASAVLKRQDRCVWYLRIIKIKLLYGRMIMIDPISNSKFDPEDKIDNHTKIKMYQEEIDKTAKKCGNPQQAIIDAKQIDNNRLKSQLEHYLSLGLAKIDSIVFDKQTPSQIFEQMAEIEQAWKNERKQVVKPNDTAAIIQEFPDGKVWLDLNKRGCKEEGEAMGHCGNAGSYNDEETVLSLREPVKGGWRPLLTFIYNRKTGCLGEMKGRNNEKPAARYHPYIIALLKMPFIKGIKGGGYLPENNFALADLTEAEQDSLVSSKPDLASWSYLYKKDKYLSERVIDKIDEELDGSDINLRRNWIDKDTIQIESFTDIALFIDIYKRHLKEAYSYLGYVTGDNDLRIDYDVSSDQVNDFYEDLPLDLQTTIEEYAYKKYPDHDDEYGNVSELLFRKSDDLYDLLVSAVYSARESGTLNEIYNAYQTYFNGHEIDMNSKFRIDLKGKGWVSDKEVIITLPTDKFIEVLLQEAQDQGDISHVNSDLILDYYDFTSDLEDLDVPQYGFDGYDKDAGLARLQDEWNADLFGKWPLA